MLATQQKEYDMAVTAKGIVKNKFWVLIENKQRIGEISANSIGRGYSVTFHGAREMLILSMILKLAEKKLSSLMHQSLLK